MTTCPSARADSGRDTQALAFALVDAAMACLSSLRQPKVTPDGKEPRAAAVEVRIADVDRGVERGHEPVGRIEALGDGVRGY
jgi:hypothetical protein